MEGCRKNRYIYPRIRHSFYRFFPRSNPRNHSVNQKLIMPLGLRQFWLARSCWLPIYDIPWAKNWRQKQSQSTILYLRKFSWGSMFPKPPRLLLLIIINSSNMHLTCFLSCKLDTLILAFVSYCCIHCSKAKKVYKKKICMRYVTFIRYWRLPSHSSSRLVLSAFKILNIFLALRAC